MKLQMEAREMYDLFDSANAYRSEGLLNLSNKGILMRVHEYSNTALYAAHVPKTAMESWSPGEHPRIGLEFENVLNFLPKNDSIATLETVEGRGGNVKFQLSVEGKEYKVPVINPDAVNGVPDQVPSLEHILTLESDTSFIDDFIGDVRKIKDKGGSIKVSLRGDVIYLWHIHDDYELTQHYHLDELGDYEIDWGNATVTDKIPGGPPDEEIMDSTLSIPYLKEAKVPDGDVKIMFGDYYPAKIVVETEKGIKMSWMIPPRYPSDNEEPRLPDSIKRDETVLS